MRATQRRIIALFLPLVVVAPLLAQSIGSQAWFELTAGALPPPRTTHTAVYDDASDRLVVFGGYSLIANCGGYVPGGSVYSDVWLLTDAAGVEGSAQWTEITPAGSGPGARWHHSAVYDAGSNRMIVYSGDLSANDVWVLDHANGLGGTPAWAQLATTNDPPAGRYCHSAVYDAASNRMIVFGGIVALGPTTGNDVWVLQNANGLGGPPTWTQLAPTGGPPSTRGDHTAVYDQPNNRMIVFGGGNPGPAQNDIWILENANGLGGTPHWSELVPTATPPPARHGAAAIYHAATNRMVMFSGTANSDTTNDSWLLDHANGLGGTPSWTQLTPSGAPPARHQPAMAYDAMNRLIVFGGHSASSSLNDTWVLTNANGSPNASPSANAGPDQVFEVSGATVEVLLDGSGSSDANGDVLSYEWRDTASSVVGITRAVNLTLGNGTHTFTLTVTDSTGLSSSDTVKIGVRDTAVPVAMDFANPSDLPPGASCSSASSCTMSGGTYNATIFNIPAGVIVSATGNIPLVVSADAITIAGTLSASNGVGGGGAPGLNVAQNGGGGHKLDGTQVATGGQAAPCCTFVPPYFNLLGGGGGGANGAGGGSGGAPGAGFGGGPSGAGANGIGPRVTGGASVSGDQPGIRGQGGAGGGSGSGGPSSGFGTQPGGDGGSGVTGSQGDSRIAVFAGGGGGGHGGCSGDGCTWGGQGGGGGGAIKLTSSGPMTISGAIYANGGGGNVSGSGGFGGGGGGGAGGTIWLAGSPITNTGAVQAVGGGGGGGGGGYGGGGGGAAGRIRVDVTAGIAPSGSFTPAIGHLGVLPTLTSIEVQPADSVVTKGLSQLFTALGHFGDGSSRALGAGGGTWVGKASMGVNRRLFTGAGSGGLVYTFGGCGSSCYQPPFYTSTLEATRNEVYNPATNTWTVKAVVPYPFFLGASAAPGNGRLYVFGGLQSGTSTYEYDPTTDNWTAKSAMPTGRAGLSAVAVDGKIYVIGGSAPTGAVEMYDPLTDTWTARAPMPTARHSFAAAEVNGKIYVVGGSPDCCGNGQVATTEEYDPVTDTWTTKAPLPVNVAGLRGATLNGKVYVFGGYNIPGGIITAYASTYEYDPATDMWQSVAVMLSVRQSMVAVAAGERIYIAGGSDASSNAQSANHAFTPPEVTWSSDNLDIATIDQTGLAAAGEVGNTTITATSTSTLLSGNTTMTVVVMPIADAGPDQNNVEAGSLVTLDGSASHDLDGDTLILTWTQIQGPAVTTEQIGAQLTFTPTDVGVYEFELTVIDPSGLDDTDTVVVVVIDTTNPTVAVTRPNASAEKVFGGTPFVIEWTASDNGRLSSFDVLVSTNGGTNYTAVPECTGLAGTTRSCVWNAPGPATSSGRIRVTAHDAVENTKSDDSNANFKIVVGAGSITVTQPNTFLSWGAGGMQQIKWNHNLGIESWVKLELTRDGTAWEVLSASFKNTGGTSSLFNWLVTGPATANARVRVTWLNGPVSDQSNANFTIANPFVVVTQPNTNLNWGIGATQPVKWDHNLGPDAFVKIEMSRDNGAAWEILNASFENTGSTSSTFNWVVAGPATSLALVRITQTTNPAVSDTSNTTFRISVPFVTVSEPGTGSTSWGYSTVRQVNWTTNLTSTDKVNVLMSIDGGTTFPYVLASNVTASTKSAAVTTPALASPVTQARLRVEWVANPAVQGTNPVDFRVEPVFVQVTNPNLSSHVWTVGASKTIKWTNNLQSLEHVKIELSLDGGATYTVVLFASTPSDGSQKVTVQPAWVTSQGRVRVTWAKDAAVSDASNNDFPIQ